MTQFLYFLIFAGQEGLIQREDWLLSSHSVRDGGITVMAPPSASNSMLHKTSELCCVDLIVPREGNETK